MRITRELERLSYEGRLRELRLFILKKRWLQRIYSKLLYLIKAYKKIGGGLFTNACSDRKRYNSFELKDGGFRLDTKNKLFTVRMVRHWNRLSREILDVPHLKVFESRLDGVLNGLV